MRVMLLKLPSLASEVLRVYLYLSLCSFLISLDQEQQLPSRDSSLSKIEHVRYPIKPRTMAQAQIPPEESLVDISSDADVTLIPNCKNEN